MPVWLAPLLTRKMLICIFTGFSSGLPLYLLISLLPAWLRTEGVSLKVIGLFALTQLPYTWKFLWSPLLDRFSLSWLGRRRSWMIVTQILLLLAIALLGKMSPGGLEVPVINGQTLFGWMIIPAPDWASVRAFACHPITLTCISILMHSSG